MSDREDNEHILQHSREGSVLSQESITEKKVIYRVNTSDHGGSNRGRSRSRSPVVMEEHKGRSRHEYSASRSRSRSHRSRHTGGSRYRSRSRSSRRYRTTSRYSYSRSHSGSVEADGFESHSRSPMSTRKRHIGNRDNPLPGRCLGVFGLNIYTTENQVLNIFSKYGPVDKVQIVIDAKSGRSRGFCFVYFKKVDDAKVAKEQCSGLELDGRRIRVDYSTTTRAHTPTPGIYMGKPTYMEERSYRGNRDYNDDYYGGGRGGGYRNSYRSSYRRSPSPYGRRGNRYFRSRSRSYSPPRRY
uniref:Transformer-2b n=1 Tax=Nilaparvata lugens TaxID=108931 RepID=A0A2S1ZS13_NILLU|nr:transformer-2b [Nilaparvata lugens]